MGRAVRGAGLGTSWSMKDASSQSASMLEVCLCASWFVPERTAALSVPGLWAEAPSDAADVRMSASRDLHGLHFCRLGALPCWPPRSGECPVGARKSKRKVGVYSTDGRCRCQMDMTSTERERGWDKEIEMSSQSVVVPVIAVLYAHALGTDESTFLQGTLAPGRKVETGSSRRAHPGA